jgi:hypothetical protein
MDAVFPIVRSLCETNYKGLQMFLRYCTYNTHVLQTITINIPVVYMAR